MRYLLGVILSLLLPLTASATGVLTPAANPSQPITVLSISGIPFIKASSGSMGNNGAVSAMTALPKTYSNGAYLYLPAGAICAACAASVGGAGVGNASAAAWYWFVGSSTTAGTVYNFTHTGTGTPVLGTATALAETGPGAFTGVTGVVNAITIAVPANLMGASGRIESRASWVQNGTAGNKTPSLLWGNAGCYIVTLTTQINSVFDCLITNRGLTTVQSYGYRYTTNVASVAVMSATDATETTTAAVNMIFRVNCGTATDHLILEDYIVTVYTRN